MAREHLLKIGVSGIRGVVGEFLTPALACAFGQAFGTYVGRGVRVGRPRHARHRTDAPARRAVRTAGGGLRSGGLGGPAHAEHSDVCRRVRGRAAASRSPPRTIRPSTTR